jgi:hypothetical protein
MNLLRMLTTSWTSRRGPAPVLAAPLLASLVTVMVTVGVGLATLAWADPFGFSTNDADGKLGALSQPVSSGKLETETADDFILAETTSIAQATITGLVVPGTALANIQNVEVELYHVFPTDSDQGRTPSVPSRANSPADVEIDTATRDGSLGTLGFTTKLLHSDFTVANTVVNDLVVAPLDHVAHGEGPTSGDLVQITVTFDPPILLPAGHYFFRPEVQVNGSEFLYVSAPKPIVPPGTPLSLDLQAWIRNSALSPDWLRIGTDIVGPLPAPPAPPTFNMTFSLTGETIPDAGTPGQADCRDQTVSALAEQFGGVHAAASTLGFSSVAALQRTVTAFCGE